MFVEIKGCNYLKAIFFGKEQSNEEMSGLPINAFLCGLPSFLTLACVYNWKVCHPLDGAIHEPTSYNHLKAFRISSPESSKIRDGVYFDRLIKQTHTR